MIWILVVLTFIVSAAAWDRLQTKEPVYRVYPIFGRVVRALRHIRNILYAESHPDGPFTGPQLREIRQRAITGNNVASFGAHEPIEVVRQRTTVNVAIFPSTPNISPLRIGGGLGKQILELPILHFGALGFGPVNENVIRAFGLAATEVGCLVNTGEDGLTSIHVETAARLIWQARNGILGLPRLLRSIFNQGIQRND